jgi:hypothetical protein
MADLVPGFQGGQAFTPSGGPQVPSPEQKLEEMMRMMGGAPNSVLMMIARILGQGDGQAQAQPAQQSWDRMYPMPPAIPNVNGAMPMRPSEPPRMMMNPNPGFIRG